MHSLGQPVLMGDLQRGEQSGGAQPVKPTNTAGKINTHLVLHCFSTGKKQPHATVNVFKCQQTRSSSEWFMHLMFSNDLAAISHIQK